MNVADTLSRVYLSDGPTDDEISKDMDKMVHSLVESPPISQEKLAEMKLATTTTRHSRVCPPLLRTVGPLLRPMFQHLLFITGMCEMKYMKPKVCYS